MSYIQCKIQTIPEADEKQPLKGDRHLVDRVERNIGQRFTCMDQPGRRQIERSTGEVRPVPPTAFVEQCSRVGGVHDLVRPAVLCKLSVGLESREAVGLVADAGGVGQGLVVGDTGSNRERITQRRTLIGRNRSSRWEVRPRRLGAERLKT